MKDRYDFICDAIMNPKDMTDKKFEEVIKAFDELKSATKMELNWNAIIWSNNSSEVTTLLIHAVKTMHLQKGLNKYLKPILKKLIEECKADLDLDLAECPDDGPMTTPFYVAFNNLCNHKEGDPDFEIPNYLLEMKARIDGANSTGHNALITAVSKSRVDLIPYLIAKKADVNTQAKLRYFTTGESVCTGNPASGYPIILAIQGGNSEIVALLLNARADLNVTHERGHRPPILVLGTKDSATDQGCSEIVYHLVKAKVDINVKDRNDDTPLVLASDKRFLKTMKAFIDHKAAFNQSAFDGVLKYQMSGITACLEKIKRSQNVCIEKEEINNALTVINFLKTSFPKTFIKDPKSLLKILKKVNQSNPAVLELCQYIFKQEQAIRNKSTLFISKGLLEEGDYIELQSYKNMLEDMYPSVSSGVSTQDCEATFEDVQKKYKDRVSNALDVRFPNVLGSIILEYSLLPPETIFETVPKKMAKD